MGRLILKCYHNIQSYVEDLADASIQIITEN